MPLKPGGRAIPAVYPETAAPQVALFSDRARDFIRAAAEWTWELDDQLRIRALDRAATATLGLPVELLLGRPLAQVATSDSETNELLTLMRRRQPFRNRRFCLRRPNDGIEIPLLLSGVPFYRPGDGRFGGYRGTGGTEPTSSAAAQAIEGFHQTTPAQTLAEEVERLSLEVADLRLALQWVHQQREAAQGQQAAPAAAEPAPTAPTAQELARLGHELRSPLNAILGYSEFAQQRPYGPLPLRYQDCLEHIATAARHLQRVVDGLGHFQQGSGAQASAAGEGCELGEAVAEALAIVAIDAEPRGIDCSAVTIRQPLRAGMPRGALVQILLNLLGNAVKFSPPGAAIGLDVESTDAGSLRLAVWDQGAGIPAALLQRIFEAGFRVARAEGGPAGEGLGLAIAQDIARRYGGDLSAENRPEGGAKLLLTVPLQGSAALSEASD